MIFDANRTVCSLPPIINGEHSKMSENTRNIFIEVTATDLTKAKIVLNQLVRSAPPPPLCIQVASSIHSHGLFVPCYQVTCFSEYCEDAFSVEPVRIVYEAGTSPDEVTPNLSNRTATADVDDINSTVGVTLEPGKICELLTKMQLASTYDYETNRISVEVPVSRPDILHQCDIIGADADGGIASRLVCVDLAAFPLTVCFLVCWLLFVAACCCHAEDVAIAYGYNNIVRTLPKSTTVGRQQPMNRLCVPSPRPLCRCCVCCRLS